MPSAVFADRGQLVVGTAALNLAATDPTAFEANPKRRLQEHEVYLGGQRFAGTALAASVFRHVLSEASRVAGTTFDEVVLTHPDSWAGHRQEQLRIAATQAGIAGRDITLVTEARAAATYYSLQDHLPPDSRICVYDFGAGTCDVAVLDRAADGTYSVAACRGLDNLGGTDLDGHIFSWTVRQLQATAPHLAAQLDNPHLRLTLVDNVRNAKETLSMATRAHIAVPGGTSIQLTRGEFDTLIQADIGRSVDLTRQLIADAHTISEQPVSRIYLVGGSSHIPLVHDELAALGEIATLGDPKTVVVRGALGHSTTTSRRPEPAPPGARITIPAAVAGRVTLTLTAQPGSHVRIGQPIASCYDGTTLGMPAATLDSPVEGSVRALHWRPESGVNAGDALISVAPAFVADHQLPALPTADAIITTVNAVGTPTTDSKSAIWSLACSFVGIFLCGLGLPFAIAALWLGIRARKEIATSGGTIGGNTPAITGISLGALGIVVNAFMLVVIFTA